MKRDGFWTGLVLGGILGIGFALLTSRMVESPDKEDTNQVSNKSEDRVEQDAPETGQSDSQGTESAEENGKKDSEQDQSFQKNIAEKFNFTKKISQLEDALKKLRDDNP